MASKSKSFEEAQPKRAFVWILRNADGSLHKARLSMDDYRELTRGMNRPLAGLWAYEMEGEAGVYPTMAEWTAIHDGEGCGRPCAKCEAHGYDPLTGRTVGTRKAA